MNRNHGYVALGVFVVVLIVVASINSCGGGGSQTAAVPQPVAAAPVAVDPLAQAKLEEIELLKQRNAQLRAEINRPAGAPVVPPATPPAPAPQPGAIQPNPAAPIIAAPEQPPVVQKPAAYKLTFGVNVERARERAQAELDAEQRSEAVGHYNFLAREAARLARIAEGDALMFGFNSGTAQTARRNASAMLESAKAAAKDAGLEVEAPAKKAK